MSSEQPYTPPSAADEWADLQAPRTQTKRHFLPQSIRDALTPNWHYIRGGAIALTGLIILLALASYNPLDPSWNSSGLPLESNWLGGFGAVLADALLQTAGYAVFLIPAFLFMTAWQIAFVHSAPKLLGRIGYLALALVLLSTVLNIFGTPSHWGRPATWGGWLGGILQYNLNAWLFFPIWLTSLLALVPSIMATGSAFGIRESSWSQAWNFVRAQSSAAKSGMQALLGQSVSKAAQASGTMGKSLQSSMNNQAAKMKQRAKARKLARKPEPRYQNAPAPGAPLTASQQGFGQPPAKVQAQDDTQTRFMQPQHQPIEVQARPQKLPTAQPQARPQNDIMPAPRPKMPQAYQPEADWQQDFAPIPEPHIATPELDEYERPADTFSHQPAIYNRTPEPSFHGEAIQTRAYDDFEPELVDTYKPAPEPVMPSRGIPAPQIDERNRPAPIQSRAPEQAPQAPLRNPEPVMPQVPHAPVAPAPHAAAPAPMPQPLPAPLPEPVQDFSSIEVDAFGEPEGYSDDLQAPVESAPTEQAWDAYLEQAPQNDESSAYLEDDLDDEFDEEFEGSALEEELSSAMSNPAWQQEESILDREEEALLEAQLDNEEQQAWQEFAVEDTAEDESDETDYQPSLEAEGMDDEDFESAPVSSAQSAVAKQAIYSYELPRTDYLTPPDPSQHDHRLTPQEAQANAQMLEETLRDFNIKGNIEGVRCGPVVTLYEFEPAPGTKTSRVVGLADDIARSMSVLSARIAVIPGRNVIGIELPNDTRETVYFREMLESRAFVEGGFKLPIALGKDIGGEHICVDLAKMPHLLIAGTTGSGKSVAVNTMILSLLYKLSPEQCKFIMVDPKMLELSVYDGIPHMLCPTVIDPKKAVVALNWAVKEMEDRYRAMSQVGVRNIDGFNRRLKEAAANEETILRKVQTGFDPETGQPIIEEQAMDLTPLPYIVIIIDELADLMLVAGKDIESALQRLAQMARAAGIHLVMATQRPSVDVITGTIKSNFPTRISFHVTSKIDSRTILGEMGAEQLLGMGDMLYMPSGGRIKRVHGPFASDGEVERVVNHLKAQGQPAYIDGITEEDDPEDEGEKGPVVQGASGMSAPAPSGDEVYDQAVGIVLKHRKVSTSFVQRQLQIGYNRAARLVERMEEEGVISAADHVGRRQILGGGA